MISHSDDWGPYFEQLRAARQGQVVSGPASPTAFSLFRCLLPNERALSDFLARLFDPAEDHGAGPIFLDALLRAANITRQYEPSKTQVHREFPTKANRKIDIVIDFGDAIIGIENKPWAREQPNQIQDYVDSLVSKHQQWWLVYLIGDGSAPRSIDTQAASRLRDAGRLCVVSYQKLSDAIRSAPQNRDADRTGRLIEDFCHYVREGFTVTHKSYQELGRGERALADLALDPARLRTTLELLAVGEAIEGEIVRRFVDRCQRVAHDELGQQWLVEAPQGSFAPLYSQLTFGKPSWRGRYAIAFEGQRPAGREMIFGVSGCGRKLVSKLDDGRVRQQLDEVFGLNSEIAKDYGYWDWYFPVRRFQIPDGWCEPAVRLRMATDDDFAAALVAVVKRVAEVASERIDSATTGR